jgi:hypothetical protein
MQSDAETPCGHAARSEFGTAMEILEPMDKTSDALEAGTSMSTEASSSQRQTEVATVVKSNRPEQEK